MDVENEEWWQWWMMIYHALFRHHHNHTHHNHTHHTHWYLHHTNQSGALSYCMNDSQFLLHGFTAYSWVLTYFFLIIFEMTYGKKLTSTVKMNSLWGRVLYCNLLSIIPMFLIGYYNHDYDYHHHHDSHSHSHHDDDDSSIYTKLSALPLMGCIILLFSCVVGTLIG